ncbi:MAG: hypothetical protein M5U33_10945 [Pseudorhodoplanes sp.]|nr:hypothetical protein [Pseudorhodoplanes sp.]
MRYVKTGCVTSLFWLALIVPSLAQNTVRCTAGTVGGKCINPGVATTAQQLSRLTVFGASRYVLPLSPSQEAAHADPLLQSDKRQPKFGLDATGGGALSGAGSPNFVYGAWN